MSRKAASENQPVNEPGERHESRERAPAPPLSEPLSPLESRLATAEALKRAPQTSEAVIEGRRHGRVEAEGRRVSDEMTRRAQERRREQVLAATVPPPPAASQTPQPISALSMRPLPPPLPLSRLLVPLDGTLYAERALPYAAALARLVGGVLTLAHVTNPPVPRPAAFAKQLIGDAFVGNRGEPIAEDIPAYIEAQRVLQAFRAPSVGVATMEEPVTAYGIRQLAARERSDLIVLATHARRGVERRVLGGTADQLVEQARVPLLVIPPRVVVPSEAPTYSHILVPLDGSPLAEQALALLLGLLTAAPNAKTIAPAAATPGAERPAFEVTLCTAVEHPDLQPDADLYLTEVYARLMALPLPQGVQLSTHVAVGRMPGAIITVAHRGVRDGERPAQPFDLVVMATHGRGGLGRWLYGSTARSALPRIATPVLLIHPADTGV